MIVLHRLTHPNEPFRLNPDSIHMIEAHPDTVIALVNGSKLVVSETPEEVTDRLREWHASILRLAAGTGPPAGVAYLRPALRAAAAEEGGAA